MGNYSWLWNDDGDILWNDDGSIYQNIEFVDKDLTLKWNITGQIRKDLNLLWDIIEATTMFPEALNLGALNRHVPSAVMIKKGIVVNVAEADSEDILSYVVDNKQYENTFIKIINTGNEKLRVAVLGHNNYNSDVPPDYDFATYGVYDPRWAVVVDITTVETDTPAKLTIDEPWKWLRVVIYENAQNKPTTAKMIIRGINTTR